MKVKIKFERDVQGSEDGFTLKQFKAGETHDVNLSLASVFVDELRVAKRVEEKPIEDPIESEGPFIPTLKDPPRLWSGLTVMHRKTKAMAIILQSLHAGNMQLSSGEIVHYKTIRKEWKVVDDVD